MDPFVRAALESPALEASAEHQLARRAAAGDRAARDELITGSLRLVAMRARMLGFADRDLADAMQAGTVGLIRAVDRFDPGRGTRLATFAWWWIGDAMKPVIKASREVPMGDWSDLPTSC